jgi:hypothetical protein
MLLAMTAWILLLTVPAQAGQAPSADTPPCRVTGTVVDEQTRAGVSGALVTLRSPAPGSVAPPSAPATGQDMRPCAAGCETTAGVDGRFIFLNLAPGAYTVAASVAGFSESSPLNVTPGGAPCEAAVEITYRLQMRAESRADIPRPPDATAISSAIAPVLSGDAITTTPGALDDMFRAFQAQPGVAASQDNRNDLLVRGGGALEN